MSDLIRRQAVFDMLAEMQGRCTSKTALIQNSKIWQQIKDMPPAQPERKKGKWIDEPVYKQTMDGKTWDGYTYCSECREMHEYGYRSNFCSSCGAEMLKGAEECLETK